MTFRNTCLGFRIRELGYSTQAIFEITLDDV
jgi:hypothetical protein